MHVFTCDEINATLGEASRRSALGPCECGVCCVQGSACLVCLCVRSQLNGS